MYSGAAARDTTPSLNTDMALELENMARLLK